MTADAGWYPDPAGADGQRWWDGTNWSEHRRPYPAPQPVQPPAFVTLAVPPTQPAPPLAPVYAPGYAAAPTRQPDPEAARRGRTLGVIGACFCAAAVIFVIAGGTVAAANWMLVIALILFAPAATVFGIISVVLANRARGSGLTSADRSVANQALTLGWISTGTFIIAIVLAMVWGLLFRF